MAEKRKKRLSCLKIVKIGSERRKVKRYLYIDHLYPLEEETGRLTLTIADYYYETLQLRMMDQYIEDESSNPKDWIEFIDVFRKIVYASHILFHQSEELMEQENQFEIQHLGLFSLFDKDYSKKRKIKTFLRDFIRDLSSCFSDITENTETIVSQLSSSILKRINSGKTTNQSVNSLCDELKDIYAQICNMANEIDRCFIGNGCVAIAYEKGSNNLYFSLSGSDKDCSNSTKVQGQNWEISTEVNTAYSTIKGELHILYNINTSMIHECHLENDVKRYVDSSSPNGAQIYLNKAVRFCDDLSYASIITYKSFKRHYSCCEKKIVSKIEKYVRVKQRRLSCLFIGWVLNNKSPLFITRYFCVLRRDGMLSKFRFVIRREPCKYCRPVLVSCSNVVYTDVNNNVKTSHVVWNGKELEMR